MIRREEKIKRERSSTKIKDSEKRKWNANKNENKDKAEETGGKEGGHVRGKQSNKKKDLFSEKRSSLLMINP